MAILAAANYVNLKRKRFLKQDKRSERQIRTCEGISKQYKVYIDFAHTPDALHKSLIALRDFHNENIIISIWVWGRSGFQKRPLMAKIANANCKIYVTDDNPRNEKPGKLGVKL